MKRDLFLMEQFYREQTVVGRLVVFRGTLLGPIVRENFLRGKQEADMKVWRATYEGGLWWPHFDWHIKNRYRHPGVYQEGDAFLCALVEQSVPIGKSRDPDLDIAMSTQAFAVDFLVKRFWQYLHGDALLGLPGVTLHHNRFLNTFREDAARSPVRLLNL